MEDTALAKWTGTAGLVVFALTMAVILLYFIYSGPPPVMNVLARSLVGMFQLVAFLAFVIGLMLLVNRALPGMDAVATLMGAVGLVFVAVDLVAMSLEAGTVLGKTEPVDPTLVGSGAEGALVIYGPVGRILTAAFLALAGTAILRTRILPAWVGRTAFAVAAIQFAFVATFFSTTNPAQFFSVNGWHLPVLGSLLSLWMLAASIALIRKPKVLEDMSTATTDPNS